MVREQVRMHLGVRMFLGLGMLLGIFIMVYKKSPDFEIVCLDVGQGDGLVLRTGEGENFLIDCGSTSEKNIGQYALIPFLKNEGISYLEGIFVSHTDQDHINGIEELLAGIADKMTAIRVENVILPKWTKKDEAYLEIEKLASEAGATVRYVNTGDVLKTDELRIEVLHPQKKSPGADANEEGIVLKVEYHDFSGLFMGDVGEEVEKELLPLLEDVDFLKVGHHGSRYSTSETFLREIKPELAVISCGEDNGYGHPAPETVERLESAGCQVKYTMESGAVTIHMEGNVLAAEGFIAF